MNWTEGKYFEVLPEKEVKSADDVQMYNKLPENEKQYSQLPDKPCCRKSFEVENCCREFYMISHRNCCRRWIEPICLREGHPAGFRRCWMRKANSVLSLLTHGCWQTPCGVDYSMMGCCIEQAIPAAIKPVGRDEDQSDWTGSFGWNLGKKGVHTLWTKRQEKQKTYKDVVRFCMEKIRRAKLELNLVLI